MMGTAVVVVDREERLPLFAMFHNLMKIPKGYDKNALIELGQRWKRKEPPTIRVEVLGTSASRPGRCLSGTVKLKTIEKKPIFIEVTQAMLRENFLLEAP